MKNREAMNLRIRSLPSGARPFVCDGFPDTCDLVLIGENPATEMQAEWRDFWNHETGFHRGRFNEVYAASKAKRDDSDRNKREISPTRKNLNRFSQAGFKTLETNVYMNERQDGAGKNPVPNALLPLLLEPRSNLKAVVVYGGKAMIAVRRYGWKFPIEPIFVKHFRPPFWSKSQVDQFARDILNGDARKWSK